MSLDDMMGDSVPVVCDECNENLQRTEPNPVVGWMLLVFTCLKCKNDFCEHLEKPKDSKVCIDCAEATP